MMGFKQETILIKLASCVAVCVASILVLIKLIAWQITGSMSLQASLVDSLLDSLASLINFIVIRQALKPADKEHRFGYGKAEALAGLSQSAFISGSALWLMIEVIRKVIKPEPIVSSEVGNIVMILATFLTFGLVLLQRFVVKKTKSLIIAADSVHYKSDLFTNISVLISLNVSTHLGFERLDPLVGGGIALYILYASWHITKDSLNVLMDHELPEKDREKVAEIVLRHPQVIGLHDLRTRSSGRQNFIQMHLDMSPYLSLIDAHQIAYEVSQTLLKEFPKAEVIIHQDPYPENDFIG